MSENKFQLMLRDLRRIDTAITGLNSTIYMNPTNLELIKERGFLIQKFLKTAMDQILEVAQTEAIVWDSILLGVGSFTNEIMSLAENNLTHIVIESGMELGVKEVVQ